MLRLTAAIDEIRSAHGVLTRGDAAISEEVAQVREDARKVMRIGDGLSRTVDQLTHEADGLEAEVFRFKLPEPQRGGTLRIGIHQSEMFEATRNLDPLFTLDNQLVEISANLYCPLLRSEDGVIVPELAERWEADPSARRYRFYLRKDARFTDGTLLTAHDVKRHFERLLDPKVNSPDQWILARRSRAPPSSRRARPPRSRGVEVLDEHTLEIRLEEPKAFFLHLVTLSGDARSPSSTARGGQLGLGAVPRGGDGRRARSCSRRTPPTSAPELPLLDRLEFKLYEDRDDALAQLPRGRGATSSPGSTPSTSIARSSTSTQVIAGTTPSTWFLGFNQKERPYDDPRVRQAIRAGPRRAGHGRALPPGRDRGPLAHPARAALGERRVAAPPPRRAARGAAARARRA